MTNAASKTHACSEYSATVMSPEARSKQSALCACSRSVGCNTESPDVVLPLGPPNSGANRSASMMRSSTARSSLPVLHW